jgi:hypothetical protein
VVTWLLCHFATGVVAGVVLHAQGADVATDLACHCQHGDGHECPMHKTTSGKARCAMRAVNDMSGGTGFTTWLGPLGLAPSVAETGRPEDVTRSLPTIHLSVLDRTTPPAPPPPRT